MHMTIYNTLNKQTGRINNCPASSEIFFFRSEPWKVKKNMLGYYKLSRHYKFALDSIFKLYPDSHGVIIVEGKLPVYCFLQSVNNRLLYFW